MITSNEKAKLKFAINELDFKFILSFIYKHRQELGKTDFQDSTKLLLFQFLFDSIITGDVYKLAISSRYQMGIAYAFPYIFLRMLGLEYSNGTELYIEDLNVPIKFAISKKAIKVAMAMLVKLDPKIKKLSKSVFSQLLYNLVEHKIKFTA